IVPAAMERETRRRRVRTNRTPEQAARSPGTGGEPDGMGRRGELVTFGVALVANVAYLLSGRGRTMGDYLLFNLGLLVGGALLYVLALVATTLAAQIAERRGLDGAARRLYRLAGALAAAEGRAVCRISEM